MGRWKRLGSVGCVLAMSCQRMPEPESDDEGYEGHEAPEDFDGGIDVDEGDSDGDGAPRDNRPAVQSEVVPPPISGGTLLLIDGGQTAVAADPDRDTVFITPLDRTDGVVAVALEPGDEPGRVIADDDGLVHVALRGGAAIATIDPVAGMLVARNETCANPRGLALHPAQDQVLVACAGGELVSHEIGGPIVARQYLAPDLRDVLVSATGLVQVSQFRTAHLLTVIDGEIVHRSSPILADRARTTAWRTRSFGNTGWIMVHQGATTKPVDLDPSGRSAYGGDDDHDGCGPVASILTVKGEGDAWTSSPLAFTTLPVDAAQSPDGTQVAIAVAGQSDPSPTAQLNAGLALIPTPIEDGSIECQIPSLLPVQGQPTAVEFIDDQNVVLQTREPAGLQIVALEGSSRAIDFGASSRYDTGHEIFHQDSGVGLACASCHPEGADDGFVWTFEPGPLLRRTQSLRVGVGGSEPFHWDGDMADFRMIVGEVHTKRMGGPEQSDARLAAFQRWVFSIPPHEPELGDEENVQRGSVVFEEAGCATCHSANAFTSGTQQLVDGEPLQVPSLVGLALRPPYMHDGRALDLSSAVYEMLMTTVTEKELAPEDIDALIAYVGTL
jgi:mono/diheme cytochrome c family protein